MFNKVDSNMINNDGCIALKIYKMKKRIFLIAMFIGMIAASCTKLDVPVESELTPDNFPNTPEAFVAATGPIYTQLRSGYAVNYWRMQELSTDEAIIPARDGNYDDGGQYRMLHKHNWNPDHPTIKAVGEWGFGGIQTCNRLVALFEDAVESDSKRQTLAE